MFVKIGTFKIENAVGVQHLFTNYIMDFTISMLNFNT
jgi:hypothetical protein